MIIDGILYAILLAIGIVVATIIIVKVIPWIESKLPDERDEN